MTGGDKKQSWICLRGESTCRVGKRYNPTCHLYAWERHFQGLLLNVKTCLTSGQSRAISSDTFLTLARADERALSHEYMNVFFLQNGCDMLPQKVNSFQIRTGVCRGCGESLSWPKVSLCHTVFPSVVDLGEGL